MTLLCLEETLKVIHENIENILIPTVITHNF